MNTIKIKYRDYFDVLPDLDKLPGVIASGPLKGFPITFGWNGDWSVSSSSFFTLQEIPKSELEVNTAIGSIVLHKALPTHSDSAGIIKGSCTQIEFNKKSDLSSPVKQRCVIKVTDNFNSSVCFRDWHEDIETGGSAAAWLPLTINGDQVNIFHFKNESYVIIEIEQATRDDVSWNRLTSAIRSLLSYMFGQSLFGNSCLITLTAKGELVSIKWNRGRNFPYILPPIPINWSDWNMAKRSLDFSNPETPIVNSVVSLCIEKYLQYPELAVANEYLLASSAVPIEMKGALISVALESLTDHFQTVGLISSVKPLKNEESWKKLRKAIKQTVQSHTPPLDATQTKIFNTRVENLNSPTNAEKLSLPFKALSVDISPEEFEAIKTRNEYLHKGYIIDRAAFAENEDLWKEAYINEMRIYSATNRLYLKYLGYSGPIYNWGDCKFDGSHFVFQYI